jgi:diguanylate cyclase (GGDEF)-like protein
MNVKEFLYKQSKWHLIILGFAIVLLVGVIDHITGPELFVSIFYLFPIFLVTWFTERWMGVTISIVSAITWLITDFTAGHAYSYPAIPYWNMIVRLGTFLIMTLILSALKKALEHEKELARTDPLTGVANRRYFITLADMEINRARRYKHSFTVVYIDLDNFKTVNDHFGHSTGDALLRSVAHTIRNNIRATDIVGRLGGDEFAILLPEIGPEPAEVITHKVQKVNLDVMQKNEWPVTFSIGVVTFVSPPSTVDEMLKISDGVMYAAKKTNKNAIKYEIFGKSEYGFQ